MLHWSLSLAADTYLSDPELTLTSVLLVHLSYFNFLRVWGKTYWLDCRDPDWEYLSASVIIMELVKNYIVIIKK